MSKKIENKLTLQSLVLFRLFHTLLEKINHFHSRLITNWWDGFQDLGYLKEGLLVNEFLLKDGQLTYSQNLHMCAFKTLLAIPSAIPDGFGISYVVSQSR